MRAYFFISFCFATLCMTGSPEILDDLAKMGRQLRHLRSLPVGAPTSVSCPENLSRFTGLQKKQIADALGAPDYTEGGSKSGKPLEWSYWLEAHHALVRSVRAATKSAKSFASSELQFLVRKF